jgi:hypothetical protein
LGDDRFQVAKEQETAREIRDKEKGGDDSRKSVPNDFTVYVLRNTNQETK